MTMSTFVPVQKRGTITLPPEIRVRFGLDQPGAQLEVVERDGEIVLRPHVPIPVDQAWFWSADWQARERVVDSHVRAQETCDFDSADSLVAHLEQL